MGTTLITILSFSIVFPALAGWLKYSSIRPMLTPFVILLTIGLFNEVLSYFLIKNQIHNTINSNIYVLIESILLIWQFKNWGSFDNRPWLFWSTILLLLVVWITENFFFTKITSFSSYFRIIYSFIIVLISISKVNSMIIHERRSLLKNSVFLICASFIVYYIYKVLTETFWLYGLGSGAGKVFRMRIFDIASFINFLTNIIYGFAILWMPSKQRFTRQY